jgi:hypothetical protein
MSLVVNSAARISSVFSSIPMWILRQTRRFVPPCLRAFHSPSPSTLMPPRRFARTMYGWLLRGKGVSGDAGVISAAAMYTASDLQQDRCAP